MNYYNKMKIRGTVKKVLKNSLPYFLSTKLFLERPILEGVPPIIYNKDGERVMLAYLQDIHIAHSPYSWVSGRIPRQILWDRYNYTLSNQFYSHREIFSRHLRNHNGRQFGILVESEQVVPDDYKKVLENPDSIRELDAIFTHSVRILDKYENACFIPGGGVWFGTSLRGGEIIADAYERKTKLLSIVSSAKFMLPLSKFRSDLALEMKAKGVGDVMGTIVGKYVSISDSLTDYMYSVGIENTESDYYFTEKLLNCFASQTVPIYYGAREVSRFFNPDGVIFIQEPTVECALRTMRQCSRDDYESRKDAIIDNYIRVQDYLCIEDYITSHYMDKFII